MDYPFGPGNLLCRLIGHHWQHYTDHEGIARKTCSIDGLTIPPFRKVKQYMVAAGEDPYLPDDQQPPGAV